MMFFNRARTFSHFHECSFGIKILYGGTGRGYGVGGRIHPTNINYRQS